MRSRAGSHFTAATRNFVESWLVALALGAEGVQSLLLEGGPTLATAFLQADVVDKLLLFVAPTLGGSGPIFAGELTEPRALSRLSTRKVGEDLLLTAYVHEP